ncbi:MAG: F0F1 ATP synthase subunit epsilon [Hyphomicrobiaceae bacterium]
MKLFIATPLAIIVDISDVSYLRAEDETGAFGILAGHADFLTTLTVSVVTWRNGGQEHHVAVRGGVLTVTGGDHIAIVTRQAVTEKTLDRLGAAVLDELRREEEKEAAARLSGTKLELAAMRQLQRYLATGSGRLNRATAPFPGVPRDSDSPENIG